jgi:UDP-N-acetylglucosamine 4-epimerase
VSLNELINILKKLTSSKVQSFHRPDRVGDVRDSLADISRAKQQLGYVPDIRIEEGLKYTLDWFRSRK